MARKNVSDATLRNWQRLNSDVENKLQHRANKSCSRKRIFPLEYIQGKETLHFIEEILFLVEKKGVSGCDIIYSLAVKLLEKAGIADTRRARLALLEFSGTLLSEFPALPADETDILGLVYLCLLFEGEKNKNGSYYTPPGVTTEMLSDFDVSEGKTFFDPCCGSGAFLLAAGALSGSGITVKGLRRESRQGDAAMAELLGNFGAEVTRGSDFCTVRPAPMHGIEIDMRPIPDLAPVLAVIASCATGTTRLLNAGRLRLKESDRLETTANLINSLGGKAEISGDVLTVHGVSSLAGGSVDSAGDHRIAMAAAVAALKCRGKVTINGANAVAKSWPQFFRIRESLLEKK